MENHAENKPNNSQMCADTACETRVTLVLWLWTSKSGFKGWNKLQCRGHVESIIFSIFETAITTLSKRPSQVTWVALKQTRRAENVCDMIMHHYVCCSRCYHTFPGDQCTIGLEDLAELQEGIQLWCGHLFHTYSISGPINLQKSFCGTTFTQYKMA